MNNCVQYYRDPVVSLGTGHPSDPSSCMVSSFHYSPSYSAYRTQNATGAESSPGLQSTHYSKSAGGHDVNPMDALLSAYSNATPRRPSIDAPSNLVDDVDASQVSAMVSGNVLCKIDLNVSAQMRPAHDAGIGYRCPVCHMDFPRPQDRKRHMLLYLPSWLQCPEGDCPWRGSRRGNLLTHYRKNHPSSSQEVDRNESMIYDPWPLVEGIKDETTLQNATQQAISLLKVRAVEVQKLKLWEGNFWGRKERKTGEVHPDNNKDETHKTNSTDNNNVNKDETHKRIQLISESTGLK